MTTGASSCASAATSTNVTWPAWAAASAATRSTGAGPPSARASSAPIRLTVTPCGASTATSTSPWASPPWSSPRRRLSGVKRQTSSRPVGNGWSARSYEATGWRWDATVSTAAETAATESFGASAGTTSMGASIWTDKSCFLTR